MYLEIFTQFLAIFTQFFVHPINLKGQVVFYILQRLIHIFKDDFTKFQDNSRTKGTSFIFQEFSRTKVKFKDFSRSVRTLMTIVAKLAVSLVVFGWVSVTINSFSLTLMHSGQDFQFVAKGSSYIRRTQ